MGKPTYALHQKIRKLASDDSFEASIALAIADARRHKQISQKDLAKLLGITKLNISHWESGKRVPSLKHLRKIANVLNIKLVPPTFRYYEDK